MKTFFLFISTILPAYIINFFLPLSYGNIFPPLTIIVLCYWFLHLEFGKRMILAIISSLTLDIIGFLPVGTYMLIFVCMAYACNPMKSFFSNSESRLVLALNMMMLILIFFMLVSPLSFFFASMQRLT